MKSLLLLNFNNSVSKITLLQALVILLTLLETKKPLKVSASVPCITSNFIPALTPIKTYLTKDCFKNLEV